MIERRSLVFSIELPNSFDDLIPYALYVWGYKDPDEILELAEDILIGSIGEALDFRKFEKREKKLERQTHRLAKGLGIAYDFLSGALASQQ
jgi:hypothetical protein